MYERFCSTIKSLWFAFIIAYQLRFYSMKISYIYSYNSNLKVFNFVKFLNHFLHFFKDDRNFKVVELISILFFKNQSFTDF
jgi:hypothetical protein